MRALLVWLLMAGVAASLDRHPWTGATEAEDGCFVVETNTFPEVAKDIAAHLRRAQVFYEDLEHDALHINYVILGRRIWSRERPYWHPLTTGDTSHDFHIHVSGVHV